MTYMNSDIKRYCKKCGREYHPTSKGQKFCNLPIDVSCSVCGKLFTVTCGNRRTKETCSAECAAVIIKRNRESTAHKLVKKCAWCGREFTPDNANEKYCSDTHYANCEVCGKEFVIQGRIDLHNKTCSKECRYILSQSKFDVDSMLSAYKKTMNDRYGVDNPMQIPEVADKLKSTIKQKYGVDSYTQTQEYADKVKETSLRKYGVEHFASSAEVIEKRKKTIQQKYDADNVFQLDSVKNKSKQTVLQKYGTDHASQNEDVKAKTKQTNINKYGVEHPMMLPEYVEKARQTNFDRFGFASPNQSHIHNISEWYLFIDNPRQYISDHFDSSPRSQELAEYFGVDLSTIDEHLNKKDSIDCVIRTSSIMEDEISEFILSVKPDCRVIHNTRKILGDCELDIYLPDYTFAIECNPTATHNSSVKDPWGGMPKSLTYHKHKTDLCEEHGIFLYHVFSYDWKYRKDIVKSMIANVLGCNSKIYARKCKIVDVESAVAKSFLQSNHRQGYVYSPICLGLEYNDELVALMTFGKMRNTIGTDKSDLSNCWELVRFCSKLNTTVIGGADRLFKEFIRRYNPNRIRSFSDRAHTKGSLYKTLGFSELRKSDSNYVWVNVVDDKAYHRMNAQKRNIKKFLNDDSIDLSLSEFQIMESHGYVRVYDSGTITWEWNSQ